MNHPKFQSPDSPAIHVDEEKPIFIVGAPRSGTSLLREILNRHPRIGICDETYFFYYIYWRRNKFGDLGNIDNRIRLVDTYLKLERINRLFTDTNQLREKLIARAEDYPSFFISLLSHYASEKKKIRCGEKTPQHARHVETLCQMYPQSLILHIVRDPRAVVESLSRMPWASKNLVANSRDWRRLNFAAFKVSQLPNYLLVYYEQLVKDPVSQTERICEFLGEPFFPQMLVGEENGQRESTAAEEWWFQRSKRGISEDKVNSWKDVLSQSQIQIIEWIAQPMMKQFGYERTTQEPALAKKRLYLFGGWMTELVDKLKQWKRLWYYWFRPIEIYNEEYYIDLRLQNSQEESINGFEVTPG